MIAPLWLVWMPPCPAFVDIVAIMIDEGELLVGERAIGGVIAVLVILAAADPEAQRARARAGGGDGARAADDALLAARAEAVPIGPVGLQAGKLDMDAVGELGPGDLAAMRHDRMELLVGGDLPGHRHRRHRHPAMGLERIGREPRPDHEAVRRRIAGGDSEAERKGGEASALGAEDSGGGERSGGRARDEMAAIQHDRSMA